MHQNNSLIIHIIDDIQAKKFHYIMRKMGVGLHRKSVNEAASSLYHAQFYEPPYEISPSLFVEHDPAVHMQHKLARLAVVRRAVPMGGKKDV